MGQADGSRNISAKEAIELIRSPLSNAEVMKKFRITTKGFADLLTQLLVQGLITPDDLDRRGVKYKVQRKSYPEEVSPEAKPSLHTSSEVVMDISVGPSMLGGSTKEQAPLDQQEVIFDSSVITEVVTLQPMDQPPVEAETVHQYTRAKDHQDDVFLDTSALADLLSSNIPAGPAAATRDKEKVTIRFIPGSENVVSSRLLHPAQKIIRDRDGSLSTTIFVPVDHRLMTWVLSFGAIAEVVEPSKLRQMIHQELRNAAYRYDTKDQAESPGSHSRQMKGFDEYLDSD
jgi:hypothetical protein